MKLSLRFALLSITLLSACSWFSSTPVSTASGRTYDVATRQLPPQDVYNRVQWVHLPAPLPSRELVSYGSPTVNPRFNIDLSNSTLEKAARALALLMDIKHIVRAR
ncbi:MAG: hypothetical protein R3A13_02130 [Bdellovibrionota bacterium]